jgi:protein-tyrosine-phosphatase
MSNKKRVSFCIVCIANYCRSPVFEILLRNKYGEKFEFFSAGINPISKPNMDKRSSQYLKSLGIENVLHTPKKISNKMLNYFDFFIAVDIIVLNALNTTFPQFKNKFFLANRNLKNIYIKDPYIMNNEEYLKIMEKISFVVDSIDLKEFKGI